VNESFGLLDEGLLRLGFTFKILSKLGLFFVAEFGVDPILFILKSEEELSFGLTTGLPNLGRLRGC